MTTITKLHQVGRFLSPGCRSWYLRTLAEAWAVSVREISIRMDIPEPRVREVLSTPLLVPYGIACDYIEAITGNTRVFSPIIAERARQRWEGREAQLLKSHWDAPGARRRRRVNPRHAAA